MDLRRTRYFVVLANELHFGRAAAQLHISQPSLSQQIRKLESELGAELVDRSGRGLALTPAGRALVTEGSKLLEYARLVEMNVKETAGGARGEIRISLNRSLVGGSPKLLIQAFRESCPKVTVSLGVGYSTMQIGQLCRGELDVAFVHRPIDDADELDFIDFDSERIVAALPIDHPLARRRFIRRCDILEEPLIWFPVEDNPGMSRDLIRQLYGEGVPQIVGTEPSEEHILARVSDGAGLTFLTEGRASLLRHPGVRYRQLWKPTPSIRLSLAWVPGHHRPHVESLLALARRYAHQ